MRMSVLVHNFYNTILSQTLRSFSFLSIKKYNKQNFKYLMRVQWESLSVYIAYDSSYGYIILPKSSKYG